MTCNVNNVLPQYFDFREVFSIQSTEMGGNFLAVAIENSCCRHGVEFCWCCMCLEHVNVVICPRLDWF